MKYTIEELRKLPLTILRGLDINNVQDEQMVQKVVEEKVSVLPPIVKFGEIVPDIKTPEQEKEWQDKVDAHNESQKPKSIQIAEAEKVLEVVKKEIEAETVPVAPVATEVIKPFCDTCDSKGKVHKKNCPKNVVAK